MKLIAAMAVVFLTGCGGAKMTSIQPQGHGVVFIGDSITGEWAQSYNGQQPQFAAGGGSWVDLGVNGNTSAEILGRFQATIPQLHPQIVQIIAGTNDVNAEWVLADTAPNIETMVNIAKENNITVILGTIPPWGPGPIAMGEDPVDRFARIAQLNQWIVAYGASVGVTVADYHSVLGDPNGNPAFEMYGPGLSFDGIHPSPTGYGMMTAKVEQVLRAVQP